MFEILTKRQLTTSLVLNNRALVPVVRLTKSLVKEFFCCSSPVHEVLMGSYCDQRLSVRSQLFL